MQKEKATMTSPSSRHPTTVVKCLSLDWQIYSIKVKKRWCRFLASMMVQVIVLIQLQSCRCRLGSNGYGISMFRGNQT